MKKLKQIIPWIIALLIFWFLFQQIPPKKIWAIIKDANWFLLILFSLIYFMIMAIGDIIGIGFGFKKIDQHFKLRELSQVRFSTYFLGALNYNLGQLGIGYYMNKVHKLPIVQVLSIIFYISLIDLIILITLANICLWLEPPLYIEGINIRRNFSLLSLAGFLTAITWILFWSNPGSKVYKVLAKFSLVQKLIELKIFRSFRKFNFKDHLKMMLLRLVPSCTVILFFYFCVIPFNAYLPFTITVAYSPFILLAGFLPITPSGLGTIQVLAVEVFPQKLEPFLVEKLSHNPEEIILAATLIWMFINTLLKVVVGSGFIFKRYKLFFK
jgi:uncharacterized membrane protein YbhN (UPF0104 family)